MKNLLKILQSKRRPKEAQETLPTQYLENNFHSPELFRQRLLIEKRRAERLNAETSLIVLDLNKHLGKNGRPARSEQFLVDLLQRICAMIRETDAVSLYQENVILILLPDTDTAAARSVYERLQQRLSQIQQDYSPIEEFDLNTIETEILSYSDKSIRERLPKDAVVMRAHEGRREFWDDSSILRASRPNDFNRGPRQARPRQALTPSRRAVSGGAIALPVNEGFMLDPQIVADFMRTVEKTLKRLLDITGAIAGLALFSPLLLLAAILIKATSRGPILFKQKRLGYRGEHFTFLKMRTMYHNCENRIHQEYVKHLIQGKNGAINNGSEDAPLYKIKNDPRITPVGRFLRKTSLDELPQFWNVLAGEMSLVGPRPPIPYEVEAYQKWHRRRFSEVKPGITGLWQVSGRNKTTFDEMVRLDLSYIKNWSLILDLKILLKTIKVMILPDGF
jgi:lipopolysaccharide/colanic/teichoic acid biosynthesis glycosyltransferase/GGDEF domain-containing protein